MNLKETLLMPVTNFEMRGNLATKEPLYVKRWQDINLYGLMREVNKGKQTFVLHDGPPYANGNIHTGHMLNRNLKDFIVRYKNMKGFDTPFILGWDTHGLPIENQVTKSGVNRKTMSVSDFRALCEEYARKQVAMQKEQIIRLGVVGDYDNAYLTLTKDYEASQLEVFKDMALKGYIYRGKKPVYWSPSSESALAEAEIEYADVTSHSIYVSFNVVDGKNVLDNDVKFVIWTTTPWTLPANLAISVHPNFTYGLYNSKFGKIVILTDLKEAVEAALNDEFSLIRTFKGRELENIETKHPLFNRNSRVILGEHVTSESGTGAVHTAPGHGIEDFEVGQKYGLEILCPVDERGVMTDEAFQYSGLFYEKANEPILNDLVACGALLARKEIVHSYPHDWRTNKPLIFRATPQWFASISPIREKLLEEVKKVSWFPHWGEQRLTNMISDRADWCISRQRAWGVPIPVIYEEDGTPIINEEVLDHIINLVRNEGSNVWFSKDVKDLLPEGYTSPLSPNGLYRKETDIMDVWFDSGSSALHVLKKHGLPYPADLILEGNDQYRGWFNSSLTLGVAMRGQTPFKAVVTHGFIVDDKGEKMSKSKGNVLDPLKLSNTYGADILRLWSALIDYQDDAKLYEQLIKQTSEIYRKIRNTFKFMLGNLPLPDATSELEKVLAFNEFDYIDSLMLAKLTDVSNKAMAQFDKYDFSGALTHLNNFITNDLSAFYLDFAKDILYCEAKNSPRRLSVVRTIYEITNTLMRLFAPILPFTMEEVYDHFPTLERAKSVQLLPLGSAKEVDASFLKEYETFHSVRDEVLLQLETKRKEGVFGSSQVAKVTLSIEDSPLKQKLSRLDSEEFARLFIVSEVSFGKQNSVSVSEGEKCERCWNYRHDLITFEDAKVCKRCHEVIKHGK